MSSNSKKGYASVMLPGAHRQVYRSQRGWVIYWYAWRGGPQIAACRGETWDQVIAAELESAAAIALAYGEARCQKPAQGVLAHVIAEYRAHPAYTSLRLATRRTYTVWLDRIHDQFGMLSEREITPERLAAWRRDVLIKHGARAADHALRIFSRLWSFGAHPERRLLHGKPHDGFEALYRAPPQEAWSREDLAKLAQVRPEQVRWALMLAYNTGLRRADLVELPWSAIDWQAGVIRWVTSKGRRKGRRIVIPLTPALKATLMVIPRRSPIVLTNGRERPWTVHSLGHAVTDALRAVGVRGTLHGLRRAAATHLAGQGLSSRKIARVLGWDEGTAEAMAAIYVDDEG